LFQYNTHENKSCYSVSSTGKKKNTNVQIFDLQFIRKRFFKGARTTKLSSISIGHWYVGSFQSHSISCMSVPNTSAKALAELPAFKSAVVGTHNEVASDVLL
jgi:hypothetical protein